MKVLIADDDRLTAAMLQRRLEGWGLELVVVSDGAEAWKAIERDPAIALAILDWMMPSIEGPELCRRIRLDEKHAHIYLLLVTARDSRADIVSGMDAGADDYLTKPIDPEEFRVRLNAGLRVVMLQQRLAVRVRQLEEAASSIVRLHGLLPICSYCKNVRSDQNYWLQVEDYVAEHSDLQFSHGICPKCYEAEIGRNHNNEEA
jgi:DNA-binding response OmpR family regulator